MPLRILVVEDDAAIASLLTAELGRRGHEIRAVATAEEAMESTRTWAPSLMLLDLGLPDRDGSDVLRQKPFPSCAHDEVHPETRQLPLGTGVSYLDLLPFRRKDLPWRTPFNWAYPRNSSIRMGRRRMRFPVALKTALLNGESRSFLAHRSLFMSLRSTPLCCGT